MEITYTYVHVWGDEPMQDLYILRDAATPGFEGNDRCYYRLTPTPPNAVPISGGYCMAINGVLELLHAPPKVTVFLHVRELALVNGVAWYLSMTNVWYERVGNEWVQRDISCPYRKATPMETRIKQLGDVTAIQVSTGNWNYNEYMHGMANGLILALAIMQDREPEYLTAPKQWLKDAPRNTDEPVFG